MELRVIEATDDLSHVALSDRLDAAGVQRIESEFMARTAARGKPTVVDMAEVDFIASLGIRMLVSYVKELVQAGARLALLKPQPVVEEALRKIALTDLLPIEHDLDTAVEYVRAS